MAVNYSIINGIKYLSGTTASRPSNPVAGSTYFNTTVGALQIYQAGAWYTMQSIVAPSTPTSVVATDSGSGRAYNNGSASVAFSPVTETGGVPASFTVTSTPGSYTNTGTSSPIVVTGLQSSTQYTYAVTATNSAGTSSASSASSGVTATTVPQAPTISATAGDTTAAITITPGATGGAAISQYSITSSPTTTTQTTSNTSYTFTGLTNGTAYTFAATATNSNGTSAASSASGSVTPAAPADFESIATVAIGAGGTANINFTSIPQTYKHLQIRAVFQTNKNADSQMYTRFNGDTTNNYSYHGIYGNGSATGSGGGGTLNTGAWGNCGPTTASVFTGAIMDIFNYSSTSTYKTVRILTGWDNNGTGLMYPSSFSWRSTSAITDMVIFCANSGVSQQNSHFALYGIKG